MGYRKWIKPGSEFLAFVPILVLVVYMAWCLGPVLERHVFVVIHPETGKLVGFRLWWPYATGASFEQRNSLVVGFMMVLPSFPLSLRLPKMPCPAYRRNSSPVPWPWERAAGKRPYAWSCPLPQPGFQRS